MQVYLVGGAVRDQLLGLVVKERDWVVVGSTQSEMLAQGFKQVGKDFPVFLHPKTKEEYALARTERKTGHGYDGFEVHASPEVTLEEDLLRRDLTINAIAQDEDGKIIDYFGGVKDLQEKKLRHVSEAFSEDPLRLVRLCRFQSRFEEFKIDSNTQSMCQKMVTSGEVNHLTPERVWLEWQKVFKTGNPGAFLESLETMGAWRILMQGFDQVKLDIENISKAASRIKDDRLLATLGWYLDKSEHKRQLKRLRLPKEIFQLCELAHEIQAEYKESQFKQGDENLLKQLYRWDVFRRQERFISACEVVSSVMGGKAIFNTLRQQAQALLEVKLEANWMAKAKGEEIAQELFSRRCLALKSLRRQ